MPGGAFASGDVGEEITVQHRFIRGPALMVLVGLALGVALAPSAARADIVFELGNHPAPSENVLLPAGVTAFQIIGETNQSHTPVNFSSAVDLLTVPSNGQARIEADDGTLNDISIGLDLPNTFTHLVFNAFQGTGIAEVAVTEDNGEQSLFNLSLGNGENFLTINAINGQKINNVIINAQQAGAFSDLRQVRIGGIAQAATVPEPMSMGLLAAGGLPLLGFLRRRRRRDGDESAA